MARVTVEDCIDKVDNRFDLVLLAAHRARMISSGSQLTVDRDNDKNPVVSLREIADQTISPEDLREELVHSLQKFVEVDEPEPDTVPLIGSAGASVVCRDHSAFGATFHNHRIRLCWRTEFAALHPPSPLTPLKASTSEAFNTTAKRSASDPFVRKASGANADWRS